MSFKPNKQQWTKIKGESMFVKSSHPGWILMLTFENARSPRYVNRVNEEGHKTFRYNTISQLKKRHIRPTFWLDEEFDNMLYVMESMMLNGYTVSTQRVFEDQLQIFDKEKGGSK